MAWTTRTGFGAYLSALTHPMGRIGVGRWRRTRICDWVQVNISKSRSRWYRSGAFPTLSRACTRTLRSFPLRLACRKPDFPLGAQKSGYLGILDPCLWSYIWGQLGFREHESRSVTSFRGSASMESLYIFQHKVFFVLWVFSLLDSHSSCLRRSQTPWVCI